MKITELHIHHFRNIHHAQLQPAMCNVFLGKNGSGKTSILESIYLLSRGKSFRHHQPKHYIEHGYPQTTLFARLQSHDNQQQTVAIEKSLDATTQLRLDGQTVVTQSPLAKLLPALLFEPITLNSLEKGSQARRELLDWLMFHVEPNFHPQWLAYQKLLKQRNSLLKQLASITQLSDWQRQELQAWDTALSSHAAVIHGLRAQIIAIWQTKFKEQVAIFLPHVAEKLRLRYSIGFDPKIGLAALLSERLEQDIELGYTRMGCHRADINIMLDDETTDDSGQRHKFSYPATDVLSRGEKKLLMTALRLSQLPLLNQADKIPLVLLDDITAELDDKALSILLNGLKQVNSQLFITSLSDEILPNIQEIWQNDVKLFHLEKGVIRH